MNHESSSSSQTGGDHDQSKKEGSGFSFVDDMQEDIDSFSSGDSFNASPEKPWNFPL
jgi:hypothetical protein